LDVALDFIYIDIFDIDEMSNVFLSLSKLMAKINRKDKLITFFIHSLGLAARQTSLVKPR